MRAWRRLAAVLMLLCMAVSLMATASAASAPPDICYVRVFGGAQNPKWSKVIPVVRGTICNFGTEIGSMLGADVSGTKYYTRSTVRESGKEEEFPVSFTVERDRDFVLTYGIKGDMVTYYVRYVDASGNNIAPTSLVPNGRSGPFVANKGDRVYVAYIEIDGYTPDAYNRTAVLDDDSNLLQSDGTYLFTFTYRQTPAATTTTTTTTGGGGGGVAIAGGAAANANANANANAANNANANNPNAANNAANNPANNPAGNTPANGTQPVNPATPATPAAPLEMIDEDEVPLAVPQIPGVGTVKVPDAPKVIESTQRDRLPNWALIAGTVLLVGLIAMLYWYLLFYRKKKKYASIGEDFEILGYEDDDF